MKLRPRFLLEQTPTAGCTAAVAGRELHHMRDVMRLAPGDEVALFDRSGNEFIGRIGGFARERATIEITERLAARRRVPIILAPALIKGPRMDFIIEKAVELGATELWPLIAARSQIRTVGRDRLERWHRLAEAAAKQSLAPVLMRIAAPRKLPAIIAARPPDTLGLVCVPGARPLATALRSALPARILVVCGPEGGFDAGELAEADRAGFTAGGLGSNRLRSETAALAALSVVAASLDELTGGT